MQRLHHKNAAGSIFTTLLVGVALVGALSYITYQTLSGPVATMMRATQKARVDDQMGTMAKIIIGASAGTDCDSDNYIEPPVWVTTAGMKPTNGGLVPTTLGLPSQDPWGNPYGYCVWDVGAKNDPATNNGCGAAVNRLTGSSTPTAGSSLIQTVLAVVSAGPDRRFDTTCYHYSATTNDATHSTTNLIKTASGKDDVIVRYTYTQAAQTSSELWQLKSGSPATATTDTASQNLEVGSIADFNATSGIINALNFITSGLIRAEGGLLLATQAKVTLCDAANAGALRYNTGSGGKVEFCNGAGSWVALGSGGGGGSDGQTDINGIDWLTDGIAEYSSKNIVGLGRGALCLYGSAANGVTGKGADQGGCTAGTATGVKNTGGGYYAGSALTTGTRNTAIGYEALRNTTTGTDNTAFGYQSMRENTQGSRNSAVGVGALQNGSVGYSSVITFKGATSHLIYGGGAGPGGADVLTLPSGIVAGDLIIFFYSTDRQEVISWPAGFTGLQQQQLSGDGQSYGVSYKIADGTEGATMNGATPSDSSSQQSSILAVYSNVNTSSPIDSSSKTTLTPGGSSPWNVTGSLTAGGPGLTLVWAAGPDPGDALAGRVWTMPPGYTKRAETNESYSPAVLGDILWSGSGATGSVTGTLSTPGGSMYDTGVVMIAINPASAPTASYPNDNTIAGYQAAKDTTAAGNSAAGYQALLGNSAGIGNSAAGYQTLKGTNSNYNTAAGMLASTVSSTTGETALGYKALTASSTGQSNTAAGDSALIANTSGNRNSAAGYAALSINTTGNDNTALGALAGMQTSAVATTVANTAIGYNSLNKNAMDAQTAIGFNALKFCTVPQQSGGHVAIGVSAMENTTTALRDVAIGYQALSTNPGAGYLTGENVAAGYQAGAAFDQVSANTAVGAQALTAEDDGGSQTAVGYQAGLSFTDGEENVAIGYQALKVTTSADRNIAIGYQALMNVTSSRNNAVGYQAALAASATGSQLTTFGALALKTLTTGYGVGLGYQAGMGVSGGGNAWCMGYNACAGLSATGNYNQILGFGASAGAGGAAGNAMQTGASFFGSGAGENVSAGDRQLLAFGYRALRNLTNSFGLGFGWNAGLSLTSGTDNLAFGADTLSTATNGTDNIAFGFQALKSTTSGSYNTAVGNAAVKSNTSGSRNTGVGYNALNAVTTGNDNTAFGKDALLATTGSNNTGIGVGVMSTNVGGTQNVALGYGAGPNSGSLNNTIALGNGAVTTASNSIVLGNNAVQFLYGAPASITVTSDRRIKKDIQKSDLGLDFILRLRPVSYRLQNGNGRLDYGFIAQEVEKALEGRKSNMVTQSNNSQKTYHLRIDDLIAPAVLAVQQQEQASLRVQKEIDQMKKDLMNIQATLEKGRQ